MIIVNDEYAVVVSATDYCVAKRTGKTDPKTGREMLNYLTYHDSLNKALERIGKITLRESVRYGEMSLGEAVGHITDALDRLRKQIADAVPEMKVVDKDVK